MKVFRKDDHIFVLDNIKRIEANDFGRSYEIRFYYNDGTFEKVDFLGNHIQMESALSTIVKIMQEE